MNYPKLYLEAIRLGEEVVSEKVRVVYEREVGWMDNPPDDFPYYFDEEEGSASILKASLQERILTLSCFKKQSFNWFTVGDIKKLDSDDLKKLSMLEAVNVENPQRQQRKSGMRS